MRRRGGNPWGLMIILSGIVIILALVLPATFWWFALAGGLIAAGIWINRCC